LILARHFGVTLFTPNEERRNLRRESIPSVLDRSISRNRTWES
jgi:hypothetical protein